MAQSANNYQFTVESLLDIADVRRRKLDKCGPDDTDHVVELQLVVAALNTLPERTYRRKGWETELVDFFNHDLNLQCLKREMNQEKGQAVRKLIRRGIKGLTSTEKKWINKIRRRWNRIERDLQNFAKFKEALKDILF